MDTLNQPSRSPDTEAGAGVEPDDRLQIKNYSIESLRERLPQLGIEPYRADQIAGWLYGKGVEDPDRMTDLSNHVRGLLRDEWETRALHTEKVARSEDGTVKAVLRAHDGELIESVLIPEPGRTTLCISTQVGCPLACSFCATGALGFRRNLSTAEIVDQVCRMREVLESGAEPTTRHDGNPITNIVFMGMGEPLLNLSSVLETIRLLVHPKAFGMAPRRVTVSTVRVVPRIEPLLRAAPVNLAVSLHATRDEVRDQLVPLNRRFPIRVLLDELRQLDCVTPRRPVFFEYTLIAGINDSLADARRLVELLEGIPSKLNLIPMNPHSDSPHGPPDDAAVDRFLREVAGRGLFVSLRRSRGPDIDAACGQLALRQVSEPVVAPHRAEA